MTLAGYLQALRQRNASMVFLPLIPSDSASRPEGMAPRAMPSPGSEIVTDFSTRMDGR